MATTRHTTATTELVVMAAITEALSWWGLVWG